MTIKVFYSWQSDTDQKANRYFIRDAVNAAIKQLKKNLELEESIDLDQDTQDTPGSPEIANTILRKINECGIFLPDLTFVARTEKGKSIPNPNVLIELGYAMKVVGPERLIAVMNEAYGAANDGLPFDLAHRRWPIKYHLPAGAEPEARKKVSAQLTKNLENAMSTIINSDVISIQDTHSKLSEMDKELLQLLQKELPSQGRAMEFLRLHDIGVSFDLSRLDELDHFISTWHDAEHEFQHSGMQKRLKNLHSAADEFRYKLSLNIFESHKRDGWFSMELNDFEMRPEKIKRHQELNEQATKVYEMYQDLIRIGRKLQ